MKKKILSIVLLVILMLSMLVVLTGCGDNGDDEEVHSSRSEKKNSVDSSYKIDEEYQYDEVTSPEEAIEKLAEAINNKDAETIIDMIDIPGMYAAIAFKDASVEVGTFQVIRPGETSNSSNTTTEENPFKTFDEAYRYAEEEASRRIEKAQGIYKSIIRYMLAEVKNVKLDVKEITDAKAVRHSDELFQCEVTFNLEGTVEGQKESIKDFTETIYVMKENEKYYVVYDELFLYDYIFDFYEDWDGGVYKSNISQTIFDLTMEYYSKDDYLESTPAKSISISDFINKTFIDALFIENMDTSKDYTKQDQYDEKDETLLVDAGKFYIYEEETKYSSKAYYYVTFKDNDGFIEVDEFKKYVDGKWIDAD